MRQGLDNGEILETKGEEETVVGVRVVPIACLVETEMVSNLQDTWILSQAWKQETAEIYLVTWQNSTEILSVMHHSRGNIRPYFSS